MNNLLSIKGGDSFRALVFKLEVVLNCDDTGSAFDEEERENFPLDKDILPVERAYEDMDIEEPTPRSDDAEFRNDELDDDCRLLFLLISYPAIK